MDGSRKRRQEELADALDQLRGFICMDTDFVADRQMVVLEREDWQAWLDLSKPETELLQPLTAGALRVEQAR